MSCILAIDDRPINRQFLVSLLGYGGHTVLEAANGEAALDIMRESHPDLVITDIKMQHAVAIVRTRVSRITGEPSDVGEFRERFQL